MFVRAKKSGKYEYLQVVHNQRVEGKVRQQVIGTLGRVDVLQKTGQLDGLIASCSRFAKGIAVLNARGGRETPTADAVRIGPELVFERLWGESRPRREGGQGTVGATELRVQCGAGNVSYGAASAV